MRFTVTWDKRALAQLARIWMASDHRDLIQQSADEIDRGLANDPHEKGTLFLDHRVWASSRLAVAFEVNFDDRLVRVFDVWERPE